MAFTQEKAIENLKTILEINDYEKIKNTVGRISSDVFKDESIKREFRTLLGEIYNSEDIAYIKNKIKEFISRFELQENTTTTRFFYSTEFGEKFSSFDSIGRKRIVKIIINMSSIPLNSIPYQRIGDLNETPHARHDPIRVFWYRDNNNNIHIVDVYHKNEIQQYYIGLEEGRIKRANYHDEGPIEDIIKEIRRVA